MNEECRPGFGTEIGDFAEMLQPQHGEDRPVVNLLEEIREIVTSPNAEKASQLWSFDFSEVWPMAELRDAGDGKIARWLEHRFS